jgi:hypothetical protein
VQQGARPIGVPPLAKPARHPRYAQIAHGDDDLAFAFAAPLYVIVHRLFHGRQRDAKLTV